jgi:hypothetical protein
MEALMSRPIYSPTTAHVIAGWMSAFTFDERCGLKIGIYLNIMLGVKLDDPVSERHIVGKIGKAVDQSICKRNADHNKLHRDNKLVFAVPSEKPGVAETRLKTMLRNKGWLRRGKYPNGKGGCEFVAFLPEQAEELRSFFDIAVDYEDPTTSVLHIEREKTKQAEAPFRQAEAMAKQKQLDIEMLKLQLELRKMELGPVV